MLDVAWPELLVIGAVALVAIGPKDLPKVMHTLGRWAGRARALLHEMHQTMDRLSYETEIADKMKNMGASGAVPPETAPPKSETDGHTRT